MSNYIDRMKNEQKELQEKILKLEQWDKKDELMIHQLKIMKEYNDVLNQRLKQVKQNVEK